MNRLTPFITGDGSSSLILNNFNEQYHSKHGAVTESEYIYIKCGLQAIQGSSEINILEVGFGTGLNTLLTLLFASGHSNLKINYCALEPFPLEETIYSKLNYIDYFNDELIRENFLKLHEIDFNEKIILSPNFSFIKYATPIEEFKSNQKFDLVYFDAFSPAVQPELWQTAVIKRTYDLMTSKSLLVTYCAKGQVKRDLRAAGFNIECLQGPPGKREIIRAGKLST